MKKNNECAGVKYSMIILRWISSVHSVEKEFTGFPEKKTRANFSLFSFFFTRKNQYGLLMLEKRSFFLTIYLEANV